VQRDFKATGTERPGAEDDLEINGIETRYSEFAFSDRRGFRCALAKDAVASSATGSPRFATAKAKLERKRN
jgi:hypothetical protein